MFHHFVQLPSSADSAIFPSAQAKLGSQWKASKVNVNPTQVTYHQPHSVQSLALTLGCVFPPLSAGQV